jgi:multiple sugar transport system substrate-binding protein
MERRSFIKLAGATALASTLARPALAQQTSVRWWYHFDNPENTPQDLIAAFEAQNPDIKIEAESIPWGGGSDYYTRLFAALVAGGAPDCAMVKLNNQAQLIEMGALEPIEDMVAAWQGRADISDSIWNVNKSADGRQYYLPLQYVVLYLYYRPDLFEAAGVSPPTSFEGFLAAAQALTQGDVFGFGMRGGPRQLGTVRIGRWRQFREGRHGFGSSAGRQPLVCGAGHGAQSHPAFCTYRRLSPGGRQFQVRPHRHGHPPCGLVQRNGRSTGRQGVGGAGATRTGWKGLDFVR